jgi:hypothetical protein
LPSAFEVNPDQAMTLGLLHDVGKLAVFDRISALRVAARTEIGLPELPVRHLLRAVHEPLGVSARSIGIWAMTRCSRSRVIIASRRRRPAIR